MVNEDLIVKYIAGEAESHEISMVKTWCAESPANQKQFDDLERIWKAGEGLRDKRSFNTDAAWAKINATINHKKDKARIVEFRRPWFAVAASLILLIGLGIYFMNTGPAPNLQTVAAIGSERQIKLSDGSEVILSAGSLTYPEKFGSDKRSLKLTQGKALFKVAHDKSRPFEISAYDAQIRVLGTEFLVESDSNSTRVKVQSGRVLFSGRKSSMEMSKGMQASYDHKSGIISIVEEKVSAELPEKEGELIFIDRPMREVVEILNRYYKEDKIVLEKSMEECRLTAEFKREKLEYVLEVIKVTMDAVVRRDKKSGVYTISGKGCRS
jgi:ferric-dicitrate binding protein FerR (iron transport regulator)